jgi:hypothetical protein
VQPRLIVSNKYDFDGIYPLPVNFYGPEDNFSLIHGAVLSGSQR